jgi:energy-coupling factor transporter transmembrane protein EcfT
MRFDSTVFTLSCVGAVAVIVFLNRDDAPWGKSFNWTLKITAWILLIRTMIGVLIGVPIPGTTLFTVPILPLPDWMPGIRIGGTVTYERLSSAVTEGILICAIIVIFGAAASLTSPHRLLRVLPVYIYEFGISIVIATSVLPQLVTSVTRIRQAQKLRGQSLRGFASWRRVAIPLLEESLARSLDLAAAMDSRGYGVSKKRSRYRPIKWRGADSLVILSALVVVGLS